MLVRGSGSPVVNACPGSGNHVVRAWGGVRSRATPVNDATFHVEKLVSASSFEPADVKVRQNVKCHVRFQTGRGQTQE